MTHVTPAASLPTNRVPSPVAMIQSNMSDRASVPAGSSTREGMAPRAGSRQKRPLPLVAMYRALPAAATLIFTPPCEGLRPPGSRLKREASPSERSDWQG